MTPDHTYYGGLLLLALLILLEWLRHPTRYRAGDTTTNLVMYAGYLLIGLVWLYSLVNLFFFAPA